MNLIAQQLARQRRAAAAEPGNVDSGIVARGFAHQKTAPGFHRGLGLLYIIEKVEFAVKAAPAAGLEQLGKVLQPLFGESAPARDDVAAACHVCSMCHGPPARKEKDGRGRNGDESIGRDRDILWKTFGLSRRNLY